jgi:predicted small secreted protein
VGQAFSLRLASWAFQPGEAQFRRSTMVRKLITLICIASGLALTACNTVKGAGDDIRSVGEAGDKAM